MFGDAAAKAKGIGTLAWVDCSDKDGKKVSVLNLTPTRLFFIGRKFSISLYSFAGYFLTKTLSDSDSYSKYVSFLYDKSILQLVCWLSC